MKDVSYEEPSDRVFFMRQYDEMTPRINNSYSDIEDETTPNEYTNRYDRTFKKKRQNSPALREIPTDLLSKSQDHMGYSRQKMNTSLGVQTKPIKASKYI